MKKIPLLLLSGLPAALRAAETAAVTAAETVIPAAAPAAGWHAQSLGQALASTAAFGLAGIALAIVGYKLFDRCTPGDLHKEIVEHRNVAAAIVAAAVILGVCVIIAAAIAG
jgi:putative membrane protein